MNVNTKFEVSSIDIQQYIGPLICMFVYRYPSLGEYWGEHSFEAIRTTKTSKRSYEIRKYIRFNYFYIMKDRTHPKDDPPLKIRPVSNHLNERFDSIPKLARLCVDEQR
ncbi:hypothetical protein JTB14_010786 [Gonioctena quinquepunctata]|nr:hypothetical protein JTB14_010786 [Gonioctena quinquepunctata]